MIDFPASPTIGQTFTSASGQTYRWTGVVWRIHNSGAKLARTIFTATAGQTTFTTSYTPGFLDVFRNGVKMVVNADFTANDGATVVLANGCTAGDTVEISSYSQMTYIAVPTADDVLAAAPPSEIGFFARNTPPTGWLKANGAVVTVAAYNALWNAIGSTFNIGGEAAGSFRLPDLRGYFPRGWDDSAGIDSGRVFGSTQQDELKSHSHTYDRAVYPNYDTTPGGAYRVIPTYTTSTTNATGGSETRPKNVAFLGCIKY